MRKIIFLLCFILPVPSWAVNEADLAKCREYSNAKVRSQCVQMYKRGDTRVAFSRCKKELECWSKRYRDQAKKNCSAAYKRRAAYSSFWAKHWSGQDFDQVRWLDKSEGSMMYYERESSVVLQCLFYPSAPTKVKVRIAAPS